MPSYIAIQSTYDIFEMALFLNDICVDHVQEDKRHASKLFIPLLDRLLVQNSIRLSDLDFCAVNCGPGPFSTLRSVIASVNGLHLATNIPLIGIDGLQATFLEFYDQHYENTVVLLNAFNQEVYYLIAQKGQTVATGYKKIDVLLKNLSYGLDENSSRARPACPTKPWRSREPVEGSERVFHFIGNGVTLHHDLIKQDLAQHAIIKTPNSAMCSVKMIGALGIEKWRSNHKYTYLMPLYLKKHPVEL